MQMPLRMCIFNLYILFIIYIYIKHKHSCLCVVLSSLLISLLNLNQIRINELKIVGRHTGKCEVLRHELFVKSKKAEKKSQ